MSLGLFLGLWLAFVQVLSQNVTKQVTSEHKNGNWNDRQILEDLLKRYRFPDTSANISVGVKITLEGILSSPEDLCTLELVVNQKWLESKLRFENLRNSPAPIRLHSLNYIWSPELIFPNAINVASVNNYHVFVFPNGIVESEQRLQVSVRADVNLERFPFERKYCSVIISNADIRASWNRLLNLKVSKSYITGAGEWKFLNFTVGHPKEVRVALKRSLNYWICTLFLPTLAFITVSLFTLWFFTLSDNRQTTINAICLVAVVALNCFAHSVAPRTTYWKALDFWTLATVLTALSLLLCSISVGTYQRQTGYSNYINHLNPEESTMLDKKRWIVTETPYYSQLSTSTSSKQYHKFVILGVILLAFGSFLFYFLFITVIPFYNNKYI
ncbi:unnamed protein product [Bursaphelenchus okinawaensis]|uniref:Neurotransmitter-gated ion-channel ligand-binding domain-containing protein n=1 Tax=Bursaphelenchus okinawaensis TaxID=465554 RepID=A0A811JT51_9BILA|nr:unnamed protein product [Bursaphelenchus okinawaensis]CAG9082550.1 unnamed protein product [Bursaphelenchus okinawaensis]